MILFRFPSSIPVFLYGYSGVCIWLYSHAWLFNNNSNNKRIYLVHFLA